MSLPPHIRARKTSPSHAKYLTCDGGNCDNNSTLFAGPAWGHVNVRNTTIDWFLQVNSKYVGLVTVHW
jgi:hypothetical protein